MLKLPAAWRKRFCAKMLCTFRTYVPPFPDRNMIQETITQIEARMKEAKSLNDEKKREILNLLSTLKTGVSKFSKTHPEHTQSISSFAEVSIHEAIREEKNPQLLKLSLRGFLPLWKGLRVLILSSWGLSIPSALPCQKVEYERGDLRLGL